jgi:hypothetical protein
MENIMDTTVRTLSPQESRVVLALAEQKRRKVGRPEIIELLGVSPKAADNVIESLRRKGWLERASWGEYLVIPPTRAPMRWRNQPARAREPYRRSLLIRIRQRGRALRPDDAASRKRACPLTTARVEGSFVAVNLSELNYGKAGDFLEVAQIFGQYGKT